MYTFGTKLTQDSNPNGNYWPRTGSFKGCTSRPSNIATPDSVANGEATNCPAGYTLQSGQCSLTDATMVKKPATTPCEVLWYADSKEMKNDPQNPNCADVPQGSGKMTLQTNDGSGSSMSIQANSDGGFDFTQSKGNGQSTTVKTGPYDPVAGGYSIVSTSQTVPSGQTPDGTGDGCGIAGKPACSVGFSVDEGTTAADGSARSQISQANDGMKSLLNGIAADTFKWNFIPQIPVAACTNPTARNPMTGALLRVDICDYFDGFAVFMKAVLAVLCLYGCVRQIQNALKV